MTESKPVVVAGVPCFNEEAHIAKIVVELKRYADKVVVCDDCSTDATAEIARQLGAEVVSHTRNMGYGAAISSLFTAAKRLGADILVTIDGDGQHDPSELPRLVSPIASGEADIVVGSRFISDGSGPVGMRRIGIKAISALSDKAAYASLTDAQSGYRSYGRKAIESVSPAEMGMGASTEILARARASALKIKEVPINVSYSEDSSTHNPVYHGLDVVLSTIKHLSIKHPLVFYGLPGLLSLAVSAAFFSWTVAAYTTEGRIITNVALVSVASAIIGLVFLAVAIILWVMISLVRELKG